MASQYLKFANQQSTLRQMRQKKEEERKDTHVQNTANGYLSFTNHEIKFDKLKSEEVIKMLNDNNIKRIIKPAIAKDLKGLGNFGSTYNANLIFNKHKHDGLMAKVAFDELKGTQGYDEMIHAADRYISTSGTPIGFLTRFCEGARKPNIKPYNQEMNNYLFEFLKQSFVVGEIPSLVDVTLTDLCENDAITINEDANSGLPFFDKTKESFEFHYDKANRLYIAAKQGTDALVEFLKDNNWINYYVMKNKRQVYSVDEVYKKVRPYFVLPNAKKFLYLALAQPLCEAFQDFTKPGFENTSSAYHFSWFSKGQEKLRDRLSRYKDQPGKPDFICFGDDSYLFWWDKEGQLKIVALDISMLDGSVRENFEAPIINYLLHLFEGKVDSAWKNILLMMGKELFNQLVLVYKSEFVKRQGIPSGVPLTTVADMCVMGCYFGMLFRAQPDFSDMDQQKLLALFLKMKESTGLTVKPGTDTIHICGESYPSFLGMKPRFDLGFPVYESVEKLYASMFHPGDCISKQNLPKMKASVTMSRALGLTLCGGFAYQDVYQVLRKSFEHAYEALEKAKEAPVPVEMEFLVGCPVEDMYQALFENYVVKGIFPEIEWFRSFYTDEDVAEPKKAEKRQPEVVKQKVAKERKDWGSATVDAEDTRESGEVEYISGLFSTTTTSEKPTPKKKEQKPSKPTLEKVATLEKKVLPPVPTKPKPQIPVQYRGKGDEKLDEAVAEAAAHREELRRQEKELIDQGFDKNSALLKFKHDDKPVTDREQAVNIIRRLYERREDIIVQGKDRKLVKDLVRMLPNAAELTKIAVRAGYIEERDIGNVLIRFKFPDGDSSDELEGL